MSAIPSFYKCICDPRHLFEAGCTCGAFRAQKADEEAIERVEVHEAKERLKRQADFLIGKPAAPVTFKRDVCKCGHERCDHSPLGSMTCFADSSRCPCFHYEQVP